MDKYINIEYLKDYLNKQIQAFEPCPDKYDAAVGIYNGLYQIPAADVAPIVHGKWIEKEEAFKYNYGSGTKTLCICNVCGYTQEPSLYSNYNHFNKTKYCPNCGARMDLKDGERE